MGMTSTLCRVHRSLTLTANQDTYLLGAFYASGNAPGAGFTFPNDRYLPCDVFGLTELYWIVTFNGTVTGPSISFFGTTDPLTACGGQGGNGRWSLLPAPSEQTSTGTIANPITAAGQAMQYKGMIHAWRITTNGFTGGGSVTIDFEGRG